MRIEGLSESMRSPLQTSSCGRWPLPWFVSRRTRVSCLRVAQERLQLLRARLEHLREEAASEARAGGPAGEEGREEPDDLPRRFAATESDDSLRRREPRRTQDTPETASNPSRVGDAAIEQGVEREFACPTLNPRTGRQCRTRMDLAPWTAALHLLARRCPARTPDFRDAACPRMRAHAFSQACGGRITHPCARAGDVAVRAGGRAASRFPRGASQRHRHRTPSPRCGVVAEPSEASGLARSSTARASAPMGSLRSGLSPEGGPPRLVSVTDVANSSCHFWFRKPWDLVGRLAPGREAAGRCQ